MVKARRYTKTTFKKLFPNPQDAHTYNLWWLQLNAAYGYDLINPNTAVRLTQDQMSLFSAKGNRMSANFSDPGDTGRIRKDGGAIIVTEDPSFKPNVFDSLVSQFLGNAHRFEQEVVKLLPHRVLGSHVVVPGCTTYNGEDLYVYTIGDSDDYLLVSERDYILATDSGARTLWARPVGTPGAYHVITLDNPYLTIDKISEGNVKAVFVTATPPTD